MAVNIVLISALAAKFESHTFGFYRQGSTHLFSLSLCGLQYSHYRTNLLL